MTIGKFIFSGEPAQETKVQIKNLLFHYQGNKTGDYTCFPKGCLVVESICGLSIHSDSIFYLILKTRQIDQTP